jgi:hypothetical protein
MLVISPKAAFEKSVCDPEGPGDPVGAVEPRVIEQVRELGAKHEAGAFVYSSDLCRFLKSGIEVELSGPRMIPNLAFP